jgi:uncharacterized protein YegP (UPF0339 family)
MKYGILEFRVYYSGILRRSWKWKAVASNGNIIASGRGFNTESNARQSIDNLINYTKHNNYIVISKR